MYRGGAYQGDEQGGVCVVGVRAATGLCKERVCSKEGPYARQAQPWRVWLCGPLCTSGIRWRQGLHSCGV